MSTPSQLDEQKQETQEIVDALLADGSKANAQYTIEHHFSSQNFELLEKAAVDAFKLGFEVHDAEEVQWDDGLKLFCFDAIAKHELDITRLNLACEQLLALANKHKISYDGWGTHFIEDTSAPDHNLEHNQSKE